MTRHQPDVVPDADVPQANGTIARPRGNVVRVRMENANIHVGQMPGEDSKRLMGIRGPQPCGFIMGTAEEVMTIR